jgi:hypothetical protein
MTDRRLHARSWRSVVFSGVKRSADPRNGQAGQRKIRSNRGRPAGVTWLSITNSALVLLAGVPPGAQILGFTRLARDCGRGFDGMGLVYKMPSRRRDPGTRQRDQGAGATDRSAGADYFVEAVSPIAACAAASRATGTRNGLHET